MTGSPSSGRSYPRGNVHRVQRERSKEKEQRQEITKLLI